MEYTIKEVDKDNFELHYGEKVILFKKTVNAYSKLQGIAARARISMIKFMKDEGITKDDLIVKNTDDKGHITYDETYYRILEEGFMNDASSAVMNEVLTTMCGYNLIELCKELDILNDGVKQEQLGRDLALMITGAEDMPSNRQTEGE